MQVPCMRGGEGQGLAVGEEMQRAPILPHTVCKVIDTNALQKTK